MLGERKGSKAAPSSPLVAIGSGGPIVFAKQQLKPKARSASSSSSLSSKILAGGTLSSSGPSSTSDSAPSAAGKEGQTRAPIKPSAGEYTHQISNCSTAAADTAAHEPQPLSIDRPLSGCDINFKELDDHLELIKAGTTPLPACNTQHTTLRMCGTDYATKVVDVRGVLRLDVNEYYHRSSIFEDRGEEHARSICSPFINRCVDDVFDQGLGTIYLFNACFGSLADATLEIQRQDAQLRQKQGWLWRPTAQHAQLAVSVDTFLLPVFAECATGLSALHATGYAHGDVQLPNFFVSKVRACCDDAGWGDHMVGIGVWGASWQRVVDCQGLYCKCS